MECLLLIGVLALMPIGWFMSGIILAQLWAWFVVPQFGLAPLPTWIAVGLSMIIGYMTYQYPTHTSSDTRTKAEKEKELVLAIVSVFTRPILTLIFGYIVYRFSGGV